MPRPEPPRPGNRLSVTDIVAPGAVHDVRQSAVDIVTEPPPKPMPMAPPRGLQGPRARLVSSPEPDRTLIGLAPPSERRPSMSNPPPKDAGDTEANARLAAKDAEIERLKRQVEAKEPPEKFDAVAYFTRFQVIALKFFLPLAAILGAVGVTLGVYSKTAIEPKVDRTATKQIEQAKTTDTAESRIEAIEKYLRARARYDDCIDAERDSAIERGTGHKVETDHDEVQWAEQSKPQATPRTLWRSPPWLVGGNKPCPSKPAPPTISTSPPLP